MPRRIPDPETALRVAADEVFLAGLRGEPVQLGAYVTQAEARVVVRRGPFVTDAIRVFA